MNSKRFFLLTTALATTTATNQGRRVLTTLNIDVVDDNTGLTETSVLQLRDGDVAAQAAVSFCSDAVKDPAPNCADIIHQALENQLQERINNELVFYFEVDFQDGTKYQPFLFFQGEDVRTAVFSYLSGYPEVATQENYDMLIQACWARLTPIAQPIEQTVAEKPAVVLVETDSFEDIDVNKENNIIDEAQDQEEQVERHNPKSAFDHCSEHFGSQYDPQFMSCVQELWHGYGVMTIYQPPAAPATKSPLVTTEVSKEATVVATTTTVETESKNFGSSIADVKPAHEDSFFSLSMFFMLFSVFSMSVLYVFTKIRDDEAEKEVIVQFSQFINEEPEEQQQQQQEEEEEEESSRKENMLQQSINGSGNAIRKSSRIFNRRTFGSSLNNMR